MQTGNQSAKRMKFGSLLILLQEVIRPTVSVLLRIASSSVDGGPIRTLRDTDQQVIRSSVNGAKAANHNAQFIDVMEASVAFCLMRHQPSVTFGGR